VKADKGNVLMLSVCCCVGIASAEGSNSHPPIRMWTAHHELRAFAGYGDGQALVMSFLCAGSLKHC